MIYSRCVIGENMKKILLILVGGTICTSVDKDGILSVNDQASASLVTNFKKSDCEFADCVEFDITENLYILSENLTVDKWNRVLDTYRKHIKNDNYDGVIFAHGTDTLAYSAALFSQILADTDIPVFFVAAQARLEIPRSNGNANFRCAVECICRGIVPNVYVAYQNPSNGKMMLHIASRLEQCRSYTEDLYSNGAIDITNIDDDKIEEIWKTFPHEKVNVLIDKDKLILKECVLKITPYVGINYGAYDYKKFQAVLHGTYHSGTACVEARDSLHSILYMIDKCSAQNVDSFFAPSKDFGEIYETISEISKFEPEGGKKIGFLYGMTDECAYAKLLVAYSYFDDKEKIKEFIHTECNFEYFDKQVKK